MDDSASPLLHEEAACDRNGRSTADEESPRLLWGGTQAPVVGVGVVVVVVEGAGVEEKGEELIVKRGV